MIKKKEDKMSHGVHERHCCIHHGCKYGEIDCPVATGITKQDGPCEECGMEAIGAREPEEPWDGDEEVINSEDSEWFKEMEKRKEKEKEDLDKVPLDRLGQIEKILDSANVHFTTGDRDAEKGLVDVSFRYNGKAPYALVDGVLSKENAQLINSIMTVIQLAIKKLK